MTAFSGDTRAAAIQVGAVILLGFVVITIVFENGQSATYFVAPRIS